MLDTDLAWLAGIWDGEGSISLFTHKEKAGNTKLKPYVNVINTDITIINKVRKLVEELECNFSFQERYPKNSKHSKAWTLITGNQKYIVIFLKAIYPYLHSIKKEKAEILIDFCTRRLAKNSEYSPKGNTPYDEEDWNGLKKFKTIVRSSETTREAPIQVMI